MSFANTSTLSAMGNSSKDHLLASKITEAIERPLSPRTIEHVGQAIDFTFNCNMHIFTKVMNIGQSFVMSPLTTMSSLVALAIASNSRNQIAKVLFNLDEISLEEEQVMLKQAKHYLSAALQNKKHYLKTSSILFVKDGLQISEPFKKLFHDFIGMGVKSFTNVVAEMNDIDEEEVFEFDFNDISPDCKMLAFGFTHFIPLWKNYFSKTEEVMSFYNLNGEIPRVYYLYADDQIRLGYNEKFGCHVINLPLNWEKVSMTIFLPNKDSGFPLQADDCTCDEISQAITTTDTPVKPVKLWIPNFKVQTKLSMKHLLPLVGLDQLFDKETGACQRIFDETSKAEAIEDLIQICVIETRPNYCPKERVESWRGEWEELVCDRPFMFSVTADIEKNRIVICQGVVSDLIQE